MPQDPDTLVPDPTKFLIEREQQRKQIREMFASRTPHVCPDYHHVCSTTTPTLPPRLEGDELVGWVRSGMAIEQKVAEHEAQGIAALRRRGLSLEEWQIDPDGHILPRQTEPSSSDTTPPPATGESTPHSDH